MKKKALTLLLASAMVASMAGCGDKNTSTFNGELESMTVMVDGTLNLTEENGLNEFQEALSDAIGVDVKINNYILLASVKHAGLLFIT